MALARPRTGGRPCSSASRSCRHRTTKFLPPLLARAPISVVQYLRAGGKAPVNPEGVVIVTQLVAFGETIKVDVYGTIREYPTAIAEYGDHLAEGGQTISLYDALQRARRFWRANRNAADIIDAAIYWVHMDESGLAYQIAVNAHGRYRVIGVSPMSGPRNVRPIYKANGEY